MANLWITDIIASITVVLITLSSLFVLYHLLSGFYCAKSRRSSSATPAQPSISTITSHDTGNNANKSAIEKCKPEGQHIQVFFKRATIAVCTLWSVVCMASTLDRISLLSNPDRQADPFQFIIFPFYFIGRILLSLIFIERLLCTFRGSMFQCTRFTTISLKFVWFMMVFFACLAIGLCSFSDTRVV
eukprot:476809_1